MLIALYEQLEGLVECLGKLISSEPGQTLYLIAFFILAYYLNH